MASTENPQGPSPGPGGLEGAPKLIPPPTQQGMAPTGPPPPGHYPIQPPPAQSPSGPLPQGPMHPGAPPGPSPIQVRTVKIVFQSGAI